MYTLISDGRNSIPLLVILLLSFVSFGCATTGQTEGELASTSDLVQELESEGISLYRSGVPSNVTYTVTGEEYDVGRGGTLQIYEYPTENQAALDAMGTEGGSPAAARVYQSGNLIAVYIGNSQSVRSTLASTMGPAIY